MNKTFLCRTVTHNGRILKELVQSENIKDLQEEFEKKSHFILEIKQQNRFLEFLQDINPFKNKVKLSDLVLFSKELSILIRGGLPLTSCLSILSEHASNKKLKEVIANVKKSIEGGHPVSESLAQHPDVFSKFYVTSIKSGETTDKLVEVLNKLSDYYEIMITLKRKVISSIIYPSFLLVLALFAITYLLIFVVPVFAKLYEEIGQTLPFLTRVIMKISKIIKSNIIFIILAVIFLWYFKLKIFTDKLKLKIPIINKILMQYSLSHLCRTISMLLRSGVPLIKSLEISSETIENTIIAEKMKNVSYEVSAGSTFALALKNTQIIPPLTIEMVHIGEQTGALDEMLLNAAEIYEKNLNLVISSLIVVIEPIMMLMIGVLIALILLSMYLPIFELTAKF
ncbi:MAG: type II secretion system F family protein [Candidatus Firestonebacteria bacterium]